MNSSRPQKSLAVKEMAAMYRKYRDEYGPRENYLPATFAKKYPVITGKPDAEMYSLLAFLIILLMVIGVYGASMVTSGVTLGSAAPVALATAYLFVHLTTIRSKVRKILAFRTSLLSMSLWEEPKALWELDYPVSGEKGELITALLSTRKSYAMLAEHTTVPVAVNEREDYFAHLIKTIMESKESEIDPFVYKEVNYLCDTAKEYLAAYAPIIDMSVWLSQKSNLVPDESTVINPDK